MHPRLLKTFLAVVGTRSVTRAAEAVHLAQSSVSDQIQALEADLGATLFTRTRAGLELTAAGLALKPVAEDFLRLDGEARAAVQAAAGQASGEVTIGALETIAAARLAPWLPGFQASHPDIHVRLKVAGSGALLQLLDAGEIDAAFCFDTRRATAPDDRLLRRTIAAEPLVLVAAPGQGGTGHDLAALATRRFVATERGCIYRHMFDTAFAEAGVAAPGLLSEVGSIGAIVRLVVAGAGLALVPRLAVGDALLRGEVVEMPWPGRMRAAPLAVIWRRRRVQPPALAKLLAAVRDTLAPALRPARRGSAFESADAAKVLIANGS
jgi:DNA-binding transcriptional LysR family regulator